MFYFLLYFFEYDGKIKCKRGVKWKPNVSEPLHLLQCHQKSHASLLQYQLKEWCSQLRLWAVPLSIKTKHQLSSQKDSQDPAPEMLCSHSDKWCPRLLWKILLLNVVKRDPWEYDYGFPYRFASMGSGFIGYSGLLERESVLVTKEELVFTSGRLTGEKCFLQGEFSSLFGTPARSKESPTPARWGESHSSQFQYWW